MGKILVFLVVIVAVVVVLGWWGLMLENRQDRARLGMRRSKKRMAALETGNARLVATLEEIRSVAEDSSAAAGDPAFDYIIDKADQALRPKDTKK
jgi:hypothetical protein